jgi:4-carboxymuconolactone decarboxylase
MAVSNFAKTDPEFTELFDNFAFHEVINMPQIGGKEVDGKTRHMAILAVLLGCQGVDQFRTILPAALQAGVTPVEIKEIVYQAVAYLGIGRVLPFLSAVNDFLTEQGIELPLEGQSRTTPENRLEKGIQTQVDIFGEGTDDLLLPVCTGWMRAAAYQPCGGKYEKWQR